MKRLVLFAILMASITFTYAQSVGINAFMQGNLHEVGVADCGVYASDVPPPATGPVGVYHATEPTGLGFVADSDEDGWLLGFPQYCGDYFVPGSPVEGWGIQIGTGTALKNTDQNCFTFDIPGSVTSYADDGAIQTVIWDGSATFATGETVDITQTTILPLDKLYFVTLITVCNTGTDTIFEFYYNRNVDPDNEQPWSGDYTTSNTIVSQPPVDPEALVTAEGTLYGCFLGLGARDPLARVTYGSFATGDAYDVWNEVPPYSQSGANTADEAISIAFRRDTIPPGECTCMAFAYILDADDLEEALDATVSVGVLADSVDISGTGETTICLGDSVTLSLIGADDYDWIWAPAGTLDIDTGAIVVATPSVTTTYTATGTSAFCGEAVREVTVFVETASGGDAGPDETICLGQTAVLNASGGAFYLWTPPTGLSDPTIANPSASPTATTTYVVTIATPIGCTEEDSMTVFVNPLPDVSAGLDAEICIGDATTLTATGADTYVWTPTTGLDPTTGATVSANPESTETYTVTGTDANGCVNTDVVVLTVNPLPTVDAGADVTIDIIVGESAELNGSGGVTYSWSPTDGIISGNPNDQTIIVMPDDTTTYFVTVTDANGCVNIDSVTVNVIGEYMVGLPTAFSPNGDGKNDFYAPIVIGVSSNRALIDYAIYNRWGEQVFFSSNPARNSNSIQGWDGRINGKEQDVGTYVIVVRSRVMGEDVVDKGTFTLVR